MKNKILKLALLSSLVTVGLGGCGNKNNSATSSKVSSKVQASVAQIDTTYAYDIPENPNVYIHYYNYSETYGNWLTWIWPNKPVSGDGAQFHFQKLETIAEKTWATIMIDTTSPMDNVYSSWDNTKTLGTINFAPSLTELGIIIRDKKGAKEYDGDRYLDLTQKSSDGKTHLYVIEGSATMWYDVNEVDYNKVASAEFIDTEKVVVKGFQAFSSAQTFTVKVGSKTLGIKNVELSDNNHTATLTLKDKFDLKDLGNECVIEVSDFGTRALSYENLYECSEFISGYTTDEELGAIYSKDKTTFKLWAPTASEVKLSLYEEGDTVKAYNELPLVRKEKGVWEVEVAGDLNNKYYTYDVTVAGVTNKGITDPYAKSTGINGQRGMILDMDALNPEGWENVKTPTITASNDAMVYELHVRDLTSDKTWNGSEANRSKFLGLIEEGTTYNANGTTYKTGFDYIKELGVTHVQLQPIYDFQSVDESRLDDPAYASSSYGGIFNWGYDPQNYNAPEGSYSSNPKDGACRVRELKMVSKAYNEAGLGLIMDVVFNHMPSQANSSFEKIVPGYYFRGRNDSGAGSDTASERHMFRKFMVDVTESWIKEYKLSGYRFDLMGLHDVDTMNQVSRKVNAAVKEINPDSKAIIYGEGWNMYKGEKKLTMATQSNVVHMEDIGAFNDGLRNTLRGENDDATRGWILGDHSKAAGILTGLTSNYSNKYAGNSINYAQAHDNLTLWDKYQLSGEGKYTQSELRELDKLAAGVVYTSQGTSFMEAGQELLKTKEIDPSEQTEKKVCNSDGTRCYNRDSYNASDALNSIKWNLLDENKDVVKAYKELIKMRSEQTILHSNVYGSVKATSSFDKGNKVLAMELNYESASEWKNAKIIINSTNEAYNVSLEGSKAFYVGFANNEYVNGKVATTSLELPAYQMAVIYY